MCRYREIASGVGVLASRSRTALVLSRRMDRDGQQDFTRALAAAGLLTALNVIVCLVVLWALPLSSDRNGAEIGNGLLLILVVPLALGVIGAVVSIRASARVAPVAAVLPSAVLMHLLLPASRYSAGLLGRVVVFVCLVFGPAALWAFLVRSVFWKPRSSSRI